MKKTSQFFGTFIVTGLLLWAAPFLNIAIGAPIQVIDALGMTKSDGVDQVVAGDGLTHTYVITLANSGFTRIRGVVVTDTWPVGFSRGAIVPSKGTCSTTTSGFICNIGNISAGSQETITVDYTVPAGISAGIYTNTADATATEGSPPVTASDETTVVVDLQAPAVTWVKPVGTEEYFHMNCTTGCQSIHFEAEATDNIGVQRVNFYRWDHANLDYVDIGDDSTYPYTWEFDPSVLPFGINQIFTRAYDFAGQMSERKRIFIVKYSETYMPIVGK